MKDPPPPHPLASSAAGPWRGAGAGVLLQSWEHGRSWRSGGVYVVLEQSPALTGDRHDRRWTTSPSGRTATASGPRPEARGELASRERDGVLRPFAGGPDHRAAYLEDADGYEVDLVASG